MKDMRFRMHVLATNKAVSVVCCFVLSLAFSLLQASSNTVLVDVSGSMDGMAANRHARSLAKVVTELSQFLEITQGDTTRIITYTDRILTDRVFVKLGEEGKSAIQSLAYPKKGNSNLAKALNRVCGTSGKMNGRLIMITDGLHNDGVPIEQLKNQISSISAANGRSIYFLLLEESDKDTPLIQYIKEEGKVKIVQNLADIFADEGQREVGSGDKAPAVAKLAVHQGGEMVASNASSRYIDLWKWLLILIAVVVVVFLIWPIAKLAPLFALKSVAAVQRAVFFLFRLPKPLYNIVVKLLPSKLTEYLKGNFPTYDNFNRGKVNPSNEQQKEILDKFRKETGKDMYYKNGELDFGPVAKYKVKLRGGLDAYIPEGKAARDNVGKKAQEPAMKQMLKQKKGRKLIADYVGKNPKDVSDTDFISWKDDSLNIGKPNHNPLVPHETNDGRYIYYVPKMYHNPVMRHTGGVSMLEQIRALL